MACQTIPSSYGGAWALETKADSPANCGFDSLEELPTTTKETKNVMHLLRGVVVCCSV